MNWSVFGLVKYKLGIFHTADNGVNTLDNTNMLEKINAVTND